jgi:hypothetical protein
VLLAALITLAVSLGVPSATAAAAGLIPIARSAPSGDCGAPTRPNHGAGLALVLIGVVLLTVAAGAPLLHRTPAAGERKA